MTRNRLLLIMLAIMVSTLGQAQPSKFKTGPMIADFGPVAPVSDPNVNAQSHFKVAFDIDQAAKPAALNRGMESAARFLNMHAASGVRQENLQVALVVHGPAAMDLLSNASNSNNAALVAALIDAGVTIELCGQTAAYRNIDSGDLLPGVLLSLSAMTAHARLQRQGYTLNPF